MANVSIKQATFNGADIAYVTPAQAVIDKNGTDLQTILDNGSIGGGAIHTILKDPTSNWSIAEYTDLRNALLNNLAVQFSYSNRYELLIFGEISATSVIFFFKDLSGTNNFKQCVLTSNGTSVTNTVTSNNYVNSSDNSVQDWVTVTEAEYEAMKAAGTLDENRIYNVLDDNTPGYSKGVCQARLFDNYVVNQVANTVNKIPIVQDILLGDGLTFNPANNSIVVGQGVSYVKYCGNVCLTTTPATTQRIVILKNGVDISSSGVLLTAGAETTISMSDAVIAVSAGDYFQLANKPNAAGSVTYWSGDKNRNNFLKVEVVR